MTSQVKAYAAPARNERLAPHGLSRRDVGPRDVRIDILHCGVCHTDLHAVRDWSHSRFPLVPGHEIVGRVAAVGRDVAGFKPGDLAAVGCMVDSCRVCPSCEEGVEQFCDEGFTGTYNGRDRTTGETTQGGYSEHIVVDQRFVLKVPQAEADLAAVAPLLCAGITTYSPLRHWRAGPGKKVGIVGLGGLGHMAVKQAVAMGAEVQVFTTSPSKREDALRLGAKDVILSTDPDQMAAHARSFDLILDTVAASHDLDPYLELLKRDGNITLLGVPGEPHPSPTVRPLIFNRLSISGSVIGGIAETQEMLDFCHQHGILADIEPIRIQDIEAAYERMLKNDVKYRFVIDMASLRDAA